MANEDLLQQIRQALVEAEANGWKAVVITAVDQQGDARNLWHVGKDQLALIGAMVCAQDSVKSLLQVTSVETGVKLRVEKN